MRAAILRDGKLVVDTLPEPKPGEGQVIVRTLACGICGSDLHAHKHGAHMVQAMKDQGATKVMDLSRDIVFGHEFCAELVDHGPGTQKTIKAGTRVCSMPIAISPESIETVGYSNDFPGGYGEYMVLSEALLLPVPEGLSTEDAALTEPMAVGLHAVEKAHLAGGEVPLVIGCGPVGLAVIAALKIRNVHPIIAADFSPKRRQLAERMGADIVVDPAAVSPYTTWYDNAAPKGYDPTSLLNLLGMGEQPKPCVIFECVGVPGLIQQIFAGAPRNCRIVVVGVCMETDRIEPFYAINKELNLQFVLGYTPQEFAETLEHLAAGRIETGIVTAKVGVEGVAQAFEDLASPEVHAKILVEPWR